MPGTEWEARYQTGDTPWNKGAPHPELLTLRHEIPSDSRVLVPGCGLGHDVRCVAEAGLEVLGLDLAPSAVAAAAAQTPVGAEKYEAADFFALPATYIEQFDAVWEHTLFCAIDPALRPKYVEAVADVLRPGGRYCAVFYLDPGQAKSSEGPPFETALGELDRLFASRFRLLEERAPRATYPERAGREWLRVYEKA